MEWRNTEAEDMNRKDEPTDEELTLFPTCSEVDTFRSVLSFIFDGMGTEVMKENGERRERKFVNQITHRSSVIKSHWSH